MNEDSNQDLSNGLSWALKQDFGDDLSEASCRALSEGFADGMNQAFPQAFLPGLTQAFTPAIRLAFRLAVRFGTKDWTTRPTTGYLAKSVCNQYTASATSALYLRTLSFRRRPFSADWRNPLALV